MHAAGAASDARAQSLSDTAFSAFLVDLSLLSLCVLIMLGCAAVVIFQATWPAALEQQGAATQEISRNVQQASVGTRQVAGNVIEGNRGASETCLYRKLHPGVLLSYSAILMMETTKDWS
jgi:hypothetical protein